MLIYKNINDLDFAIRQVFDAVIGVVRHRCVLGTESYMVVVLFCDQ